MTQIHQNTLINKLKLVNIPLPDHHGITTCLYIETRFFPQAKKMRMRCVFPSCCAHQAGNRRFPPRPVIRYLRIPGRLDIASRSAWEVEPMMHLWDWYIYLHEWLIFMVNVSISIPYMDAMWGRWLVVFFFKRSIQKWSGNLYILYHWVGFEPIFMTPDFRIFLFTKRGRPCWGAPEFPVPNKLWALKVGWVGFRCRTDKFGVLFSHIFDVNNGRVW